jgi:hypothetical protein
MTLVDVRIVAIVVVLVTPVLVIAALARLVEAHRNARARVLARQIRLTDAVHAELGAIVAPVVEKPAFRPWRVIFAMRGVRASDVNRLVSITDRVLAADVDSAGSFQIVFTRPAPLTRPRAA